MNRAGLGPASWNIQGRVIIEHHLIPFYTVKLCTYRLVESSAISFLGDASVSTCPMLPARGFRDTAIVPVPLTRAMIEERLLGSYDIFTFF